MARAHDHEPRGSRRALAYAFLINTVFFVVEFVGAQLADSLALFADAVHMLTDSASIGLALFAAWVATRPPDAKRTYGYQRAEVLGALANGVFLLAVVAYILWDAWGRFQDPRPIDAPLVIVVGAIGLVANLAAARVLAGDRGNLNVRAAYLHLLADAAGSVAAIAVGVALTFTDLYVLDPLFAVLIAGLVLYTTRDLLADSVNVLLQGTPRSIDTDAVAAALAEVEPVTDVHHVHVWALSSSRYALSAHVVVPPDTDPNAVIATCRGLARDRFGIEHVTIQVETD